MEFGIGEWRTRDGRKAAVKAVDNSNKEYPLRGEIVGIGNVCWTAEGRLWRNQLDEWDLFALTAEAADTQDKRELSAVPAMDLRDWFAGMALHGITAMIAGGAHSANGPAAVARDAYELADAMLAARKGGA
jgi:hypothetical protein